MRPYTLALTLSKVCAMGACLPKSLTCGEVNPNTKLFNVCCGGQVIIENSEVDGTDKDGEEAERYTSTLRRQTRWQRKDKGAPALAVL